MYCVIDDELQSNDQSNDYDELKLYNYEVQSIDDELKSIDHEVQPNNEELGDEVKRECRNCAILESKLKSECKKAINSKKQASNAQNQAMYQNPMNTQTNNTPEQLPFRRPRLDIGRVVIKLPTVHSLFEHLKGNPLSSVPTWTLLFDSLLHHFLILTNQYIETFIKRSNLWNQQNPRDQIPINLPEVPLLDISDQLLPALGKVVECQMPDRHNLMRKLRNSVMHGSYQILGKGGNNDPRVFEFIDDLEGTGGVGARCDGNLMLTWVYVNMRRYSIALCEWALVLNPDEFRIVFRNETISPGHVQSWLKANELVPCKQEFLSYVLNIMHANNITYEVAKENYKLVCQRLKNEINTNNLNHEEARDRYLSLCSAPISMLV